MRMGDLSGFFVLCGEIRPSTVLHDMQS
jgi:hypothetical protein